VESRRLTYGLGVFQFSGLLISQGELTKGGLKGRISRKTRFGLRDGRESKASQLFSISLSFQKIGEEGGEKMNTGSEIKSAENNI